MMHEQAMIPNIDNTNEAVPNPAVGFLLIVLSCFFIFLTWLTTMMANINTTKHIANNTILMVIRVFICA